MNKKRLILVVISLVASFILGAGAVLFSYYLEWDAFATVSALVAVGGVSTALFTAALKGKIDVNIFDDDDDEDD
jgi:CHASE2 domain-containing sensor protein